MKSLGPTWFTDHTTDPEYKKYIFLDYLNSVEADFSSRRIVPALKDLRRHHEEIRRYLSTIAAIDNAKHGELTGINIAEKKLDFDRFFESFPEMDQVQDVMRFALPLLTEEIAEGQELFTGAISRISYDAVGLLPQYRNEGYFFIQNLESDIHVFSYRSSFYSAEDSAEKQIIWQYEKSYVPRFTNTPLSIKRELIRENKYLPNPATFYFYSNEYFPLEETFIPASLYFLRKNLD